MIASRQGQVGCLIGANWALVQVQVQVAGFLAKGRKAIRLRFSVLPGVVSAITAALND